jgi:hypothetical protein
MRRKTPKKIAKLLPLEKLLWSKVYIVYTPISVHSLPSSSQGSIEWNILTESKKNRNLCKMMKIYLCAHEKHLMLQHNKEKEANFSGKSSLKYYTAHSLSLFILGYYFEKMREKKHSLKWVTK